MPLRQCLKHVSSNGQRSQLCHPRPEPRDRFGGTGAYLYPNGTAFTGEASGISDRPGTPGGARGAGVQAAPLRPKRIMNHRTDKYRRCCRPLGRRRPSAQETIGGDATRACARDVRRGGEGLPVRKGDINAARTSSEHTFRRVAVSSRGPEQSPVRPFACCVGSLRSDGRRSRCLFCGVGSWRAGGCAGGCGPLPSAFWSSTLPRRISFCVRPKCSSPSARCPPPPRGSMAEAPHGTVTHLPLPTAQVDAPFPQLLLVSRRKPFHVLLQLRGLDGPLVARPVHRAPEGHVLSEGPCERARRHRVGRGAWGGAAPAMSRPPRTSRPRGRPSASQQPKPVRTGPVLSIPPWGRLA